MKQLPLLIKSTVPVGFTHSMENKFRMKGIIFSPEFLREGQALRDNLYPSRIIMGSERSYAEICSPSATSRRESQDIETLFMHPTEAEAVKLFANTYLADASIFF